MAKVEIPLRNRADRAIVDDAHQHPETRALMLGFHRLEQVWQLWAEAAHNLSMDLGVPLCVEGCGLCCATNTPSAWGVEVKRAAAFLLEQTPETRERILDRIEAWLVRPVLELEPPLDPSLGIRHPLMGNKPVGALKSELSYQNQVCLRGRCPLLGDHLECLVYEARPLACRAWDVTTLAAGWCKRPTGLGETADTRMKVVMDDTAPLRAHLRILTEHLKNHPHLSKSYLFPTALYAQFREGRLNDLLPHIPSGRLVGGKDVIRGVFFDEALPQPIQVIDGEARA